MKEDLKLRAKIFAHKCVKLALKMPNNKLGWYIEGQIINGEKYWPPL